MGMFKNVVCPISKDRVDSNVSRLTVFLNAVLIAAYVFTEMPIFIAIVAVDYVIRGAFPPKYSPIRWVSSIASKTIKMPVKMVDAAPKLFASRIGILFSVGALLLFPTYFFASVIVASILLVFALLDSVLNICFGCLTYHYIVFPLLGGGQTSSTK